MLKFRKYKRLFKLSKFSNIFGGHYSAYHKCLMVKDINYSAVKHQSQKLRLPVVKDCKNHLLSRDFRSLHN